MKLAEVINLPRTAVDHPWDKGIGTSARTPPLTFTQVKPPAVQSTVPTSKLQSDVAQSSLVASAAATIAPQTVAQGPKPGNAPLAAATAAKRKSVGADSQLAQSPPVKRHRVSSQSDDDGEDALS